VDVDQYQEIAAMDPKDAPPELHIAAWPSYVLTSMVKSVVAVYVVLRDYSRGIFTSGVRQLGLAEDGVDIAYSGGFIDDIRSQIEDLRARSSRAMSSSLRNCQGLSAGRADPLCRANDMTACYGHCRGPTFLASYGVTAPAA
jgi:hypothetical protein